MNQQFGNMVDWDMVGFVLASRHRRSILQLLERGPSTPKRISDELNIHMSHTSQLIHSLLNRDLVTCLNPTAKRGRIYDLTKQGREISNILSNQL